MLNAATCKNSTTSIWHLSRQQSTQRKILGRMKEMRKLNKGSKRILLHPYWVFTSKEPLLLESNLKNPNKPRFWCCIFSNSNHRKSKTPPSYELNFADSAYGLSQFKSVCSHAVKESTRSSPVTNLMG